MGTCFIVYRLEYSEKAGRLHGNPWVWKVVQKTRLSPPRDEEGFRTWLWHLVQKYGSGQYRIVRTQARGERAGYHGIFYGHLDEDYITVERRYPQYKSHPGLGPSRQLWYKGVKERKRFYKRRRY